MKGVGKIRLELDCSGSVQDRVVVVLKIEKGVGPVVVCIGVSGIDGYRRVEVFHSAVWRTALSVSDATIVERKVEIPLAGEGRGEIGNCLLITSHLFVCDTAIVVGVDIVGIQDQSLSEIIDRARQVASLLSDGAAIVVSFGIVRIERKRARVVVLGTCQVPR